MTVELVRPSVPWHRDPKNLAQLWRWLDEQARTPEDPAYFMDRGEKWSDCWEEFQREEAQDRMLTESCFEDDLQRRSAL